MRFLLHHKWLSIALILGYAVPVLIFSVPISRFMIPFGLIRTLVPIVNLTAQYPVDPDWSSILFFIGPINAITYIGIGLFIRVFLDQFESTTQETERRVVPMPEILSEPDKGAHAQSGTGDARK